MSKPNFFTEINASSTVLFLWNIITLHSVGYVDGKWQPWEGGKEGLRRSVRVVNASLTVQFLFLCNVIILRCVWYVHGK